MVSEQDNSNQRWFRKLRFSFSYQRLFRVLHRAPSDNSNNRDSSNNKNNTIYKTAKINNNSKKAINNNRNRMSAEEVQMKAHSS